MSYDFKKIADLELVNEVPEGANVLIETEGATKRLPSTAINNGYAKDEVYNKTETYSKDEAYSKDEVYNKAETYSKDEVYDKTEADNQFLAKEAIAKPDWNQNDENAADYVKNRTHYKETISEYVIFDADIESDSVQTVPIEYAIPVGAVITIYTNGLTLSAALDADGSELIARLMPGVNVRINNESMTATISNYEFPNTSHFKVITENLVAIKPLAEEYIPSTIARRDVFIVHYDQSGDDAGKFYISESIGEVRNAIAGGKAVLLQVNKEGNFANYAGKNSTGLELYFVGFTGTATDDMNLYLYTLYTDGGVLRDRIYTWT